MTGRSAVLLFLAGAGLGLGGCTIQPVLGVYAPPPSYYVEPPPPPPAPWIPPAPPSPPPGW
ncbi:hypothetical protein QMO56_16935 [Roseomonas sp. E05]|uniref:hypothetical protein n=1 Tax=Roseomonas sp. E05 TaxID=3046310 RepID=UPI0024BA6ED7|nr:hypothetical protein [Roseomonas sp. E05]MDJ0389798.1 hypothetical protein [Roseomonas sp. E05]